MKNFLKFALLILLSLLCSGKAHAQCSAFSYSQVYGQVQTCTAGSAVSQGQILSLNASNQVIPIPASSTGGIFGVALQSGSTGAQVLILITGQGGVSTDNACTVGQNIIPSTSVAGNGHCTSSPGTTQFVGTATTATGAAGSTLAQVSPLSSGQAGTGGGGGSTPAAGIVDTTLAPYSLTRAVIVGSGANFTITSGSPNVTCTTCVFTAGDTAKLFAASNWTGTDANYLASASVIPAGTTILTFTDATHVVLSANATANAGTTNSNNGWMAYGADALTGFNLAITNAWTGTVCQFIALPSFPVMLSAAPSGTASCPGTQGGSTASHYAGIGGLASFTSMIIPAPGFTCALAQCFGGSNEQGVLWINVTFNGGGQNINLNGKNFFTTANDGQYENLSFFGISASPLTTRTMNCVNLTPGYHKFYTVTIDGCGDAGTSGNTSAGLIVTSGNVAQTTYSGFVGNTGGSLVIVQSTAELGLRDWSYQMNASSGNGLGLDISGTLFDFGGNFITGPNISSAAWKAETGGTIYLSNVYGNNSANTTAVVIQAAGTGTVRSVNARGFLANASSSVWSCATTSTCDDQGGNIYLGGPVGNTGCASSASPAVCVANTYGAVAVPAASATLTVNTSMITPSSAIQLTEDSSLGARLGVTCNATPTVQSLTVTAIVNGTSFTFSNTAPTTNPRCVRFVVRNM